MRPLSLSASQSTGARLHGLSSVTATAKRLPIGQVEPRAAVRYLDYMVREQPAAVARLARVVFLPLALPMGTGDDSLCPCPMLARLIVGRGKLRRRAKWACVERR
jgi:hypothetical protein